MKHAFNILYYNQLSSTNDEARKLLSDKICHDFTIINTKGQTKGRGQKEALWHSEYNMNLLFSIIVFPKNIKAAEQFYLSKVISLGIVNYLNSKTRGFKIKWPNDIYYHDKKICGILIENTISGSEIKNSIIGIGMNINQKEFPDFLPKAVSLTNITNNKYDLKKELNLLLEDIEKKYKNLKSTFFKKIDTDYHKLIYKLNEFSDFKDANSNFKGKIIGTMPEGNLIIQLIDNQLRTYNFKEVEFL